MPDIKPATFGPDRIRVHATTTGADINTETHDRHTVQTVLDLLLGDLAYDFDDVANQRPSTDGHAPEPLLYERLIENLVAALPGNAPLYGAEVARFADELHTIARPKGIPAQRGAA